MLKRRALLVLTHLKIRYDEEEADEKRILIQEERRFPLASICSSVQNVNLTRMRMMSGASCAHISLSLLLLSSYSPFASDLTEQTAKNWEGRKIRKGSFLQLRCPLPPDSVQKGPSQGLRHSHLTLQILLLLFVKEWTMKKANVRKKERRWGKRKERTGGAPEDTKSEKRQEQVQKYAQQLRRGMRRMKRRTRYDEKFLSHPK